MSTAGPAPACVCTIVGVTYLRLDVSHLISVVGPVSPLHFGFLYGTSFMLLLSGNMVHNVTYAIVGVGGIVFWDEVVGVVVLFFFVVVVIPCWCLPVCPGAGTQ